MKMRAMERLYEHWNLPPKEGRGLKENIQQISVLKLITICAEKINLQHVLYLLAFLIFGIGDGITSAYMIDMRGVAIEANPVMRFLFITQGFEGLVLAKVWFTFAMLLAVYIVQLRSPTNMYWSVNGFLIALIIGGSMAVNANLNALAGEVPSGPGGILFTYIVLALILIEIGDNVDKRTAHRIGPRQSQGLLLQKHKHTNR